MLHLRFILRKLDRIVLQCNSSYDLGFHKFRSVADSFAKVRLAASSLGLTVPPHLYLNLNCRRSLLHKVLLGSLEFELWG